MTTRVDTIHDDIVSSLNGKINETVSAFNDTMSEKERECETGNVPIGENVFEPFIRALRKQALTQFIVIKAWLGNYVLSTVIQQVRTSGIYKLHETKEAITATKAEQQKALEERKRIFDNEDALSDYELFTLYGHPEFKQSSEKDDVNKTDNNNPSAERKLSPKVDLAYKKYLSKSRRSFIIGLSVTVCCIAIDFSMIYTLFLSANYPTTLAMIIAVISAAMLDGPPYVLGYIWSKNDDGKSLFELQNIAHTSEAKRKNKGNKILLNIMIIVIVLAFLAYLTVRILSFLGGGNFDLAFHAIIQADWSRIDNVEFSGADFLSTIVPFATSVVALAVGKTLYASRTDYIKETVTIIKDEINTKIKMCNESIVDYKKKTKDLEERLTSLKREIWTFYYGKKPFPSSEEVFRQEVSIAFQKLNLMQYKQTYSDCCLLLRNRAIILLGDINSSFAKYAANPSGVIAIDVSDEEKNMLDEFWVVSTNDRAQRPLTISHLTSIDNRVNDLLKQLK